MQAGDYRLALAAFDDLVERNPGFAEAWNKRATLHYLMGNDEASVADIVETLELEPRHFGALSGLALIYERNGQPAAAASAPAPRARRTPADGRRRAPAQAA